VLRLVCCLLLVCTLAEAAPESDHRRMCRELAGLGRAEEAVAECEKALNVGPASPYDKMALAAAIAQTKRDLPRALALAKEALPELSADPMGLAMYCTVLLDTRTLPGVDYQLNECIARLYVLDPEGMESNYLGAVVATLRGHRDLAHKRLDVAKKAGLPDATYTQLAAEIDKPAQPVAPVATEPPPRHTASMLVLLAGIIMMVAVVLIGVRLSRRRRTK
jgi:hypothetical protein